jgi:hypothetical protein
MPERFNGLTDAQWKLLEPLYRSVLQKDQKANPTLPGEKFVIAYFGLPVHVGVIWANLGIEIRKMAW